MAQLPCSCSRDRALKLRAVPCYERAVLVSCSIRNHSKSLGNSCKRVERLRRNSGIRCRRELLGGHFSGFMGGTGSLYTTGAASRPNKTKQ